MIYREGRFSKENLITKNVAEGLTSAPRFYIPPKVHKQGYPERPAINSVNSHISNISDILLYVDYHLQLNKYDLIYKIQVTFYEKSTK